MPRGTGRYDEACRQGRMWTPQVYVGAGLSGWYDGRCGSFTIATGISQWNDKSGLGRNPANATGTKQPLFNGSYINGFPAVVFDGTDDYLTVSLAATPGSWTTAAIWRPTSVTGVRSVVDTDDAGGTGRHAQDIRQNGTALESIGFNTVPTAFTDASGITLAANTNYLGVAVRGATSIETWGNGSSNGSTAASGTAATAAATLTLGAFAGSNPVNTAFFMAGGIGEVLRFDTAFAQFERQRLEGYLAWRWCTVGDLPASHPFRNRPPMIGD